MAGKKDRERFTIKFNENDPAHRKVIEILESQGAHSKAPFIVNAILHYIHCPETPDIPVSWLMDKGTIEEMVRGILKEQASEATETPQTAVNIQPLSTQQTAAELQPAADGEPVSEIQAKTDQKTEENPTRALIMNTLSAFRNN